MSDQPVAPDWFDGVKEDMARQILHQAEIHMNAQLQAALAADLRSVTVASIFLAFSSAVGAAAVLFWTQAQDWAVLVSGLCGAVTMSIWSVFCFHAARPVHFYFPGNHPEKWWGCEDLAQALIGESENYQERIELNAKCLEENAGAFTTGTRFAIASPVVGFVVWVVISSIYP